LDPNKNVEGLLKAVAALGPLRPDVLLVVAGTGERSYAEDLQARARTLGIGERVIWLGHVEGSFKAAVFATADAFILPSFSENFAISAVEALLAGVPCVLGRGVALAKDVHDAGAGLVTAPEPEAIAQAIEQLLNDDELRHQMGARGNAFAKRQYSTRAMADRLIALYQDVGCSGG
jgi:glycosyltransferase involved in cell wall biosynthesis